MSLNDYLQLILLITVNIMGFFLGFIVFRSNTGKKLNISFGLLTFFALVWANFSFLGFSTNSAYLSSIYFKINYAAVSLFLYTAYRFFVIDFAGNKHRVFCYYIFLTSFSLSLLSTFTSLIIEGVDMSAGEHEIVYGQMSVFYDLYALIIALLILYFMIRKYRQAHINERIRIQYFLVGTLLYATMNMIFNIIFPVFFHTVKYSWLGDYSIVIFLCFTAYAIVKNHLFDVKLAVVRSVAYTLVLITLACIYLILSFLLSAIFNKELTSPGQTVSGVAISLVLAFVFQPIKRFFDRVTDKIFYRDNYNTDDFYARLNNTLTLTTDLRSLLERTAYEIANTLKCEQAFFFIHTFDDHFITAGTHGYNKMPRDDALELQIVDEMDYGLFIASLRDENDPIRRLMVSHKIELILPLRQSNVIGYLCLGDHRTSNYTGKDIRVLNTISDGLVIAIQNALAIQEVRELNTNLQQKINNATRELRNSNMMLRKLDKIKDEFVSIASHQLRTPLTSVKGYISMILDGDAGKINNQQRELLGEAFISSERMVHLINDFLNVSRLQTGKFMIDKKPTDLSKVVGEEIDSLRPSAVSRGIEFIYKPPKNIPILDIDEGKIRQVIMNFADNSLYYSDKDTKVKIDLHIEDNEIVFTVKDRGIGVPKNEQAQLFSKFYRASNARLRRPDGTGVGLFLAKKVIDAHKGQIVFESSEGKGSTFGFRLPIAENSLPSPESSE